MGARSLKKRNLSYPHTQANRSQRAIRSLLSKMHIATQKPKCRTRRFGPVQRGAPFGDFFVY